MLMYDTARTIGVCLFLGGALSLMSHLAGQMSVGSAPGESLVGGGAALVLGGLLCLLGDIGKRLIRLEQQMTGKPHTAGEPEDLVDLQS